MRIKDLFTVPEEEKVTEKMFRRVLISSVCSILLCMTCLVSATWAWFAASVENTGNVIEIGEPEVKLTVNGKSFPSGNSLPSGDHEIMIEHANELDDLQKKSTLYVVFSADDAIVGYITLGDGSSVSTYTTASREYAATLTVKAGKAFKFSWEVSWIRPDQAKALTDNTITVSNGATMAGRYMHISFDDVEHCFNNLKSGYSSMYEEPFFAWLKALHDEYGAKFSLYTYNNILEGVPSTYAAEFAAASDWLKIGLHAENKNATYASSNYNQGKAAWNTFVGHVKKITGTTDSVDRIPRLHYFAGSQTALEGMKAAECGALGFLAADDIRNSYYLSNTVSANLYNTNHITDLNNGLVFLNTDMRGDWFLDGWSPTNDYREPTYDTVYAEMQDRYSSDAYAGMLGWCIFFSHEWQFYNGTTFLEGKKWTEDACKFASENGITFGYPQVYTFGQSEYDIPIDNGTTAVFDGVTLNVVDDFSKVQFISGYTINGSILQYEEKTARAISKTEVLKVSDSMRHLSLDLTRLSITDKLYYTVYEFSDHPLNSSTFKTGGGAWTQEDVTLADTTQYVIIIFRNGTDAEFTEADLALLNQCVSFGETTDSGSTDTDTDTDKDAAMTTRNGETVAIVSNLSDMSYVRGSFSGGINSTEATSVTGRAISRYYVLKVNGGEMLSLQQNIGGVTLSFAIKEFTDIPLEDGNITSSGQTYNSWLSESVILQENTQYIIIGFKNGDGSIDFTDEQLAKLPECLTFSSTGK